MRSAISLNEMCFICFNQPRRTNSDWLLLGQIQIPALVAHAGISAGCRLGLERFQLEPNLGRKNGLEALVNHLLTGRCKKIK
jgi:hypothetical protein